MPRYDNRHSSRGNKALFGALIVVIGLALLVKKLGILPYFDFHLTWPVILIIIGFFIGLKNGFRNSAPFILIAIGVFNLVPAFSFNIGGRMVDSEDLAIPSLLILGGLIIIFKPRKKKHCIPGGNREIVSDNAIHTNIVFGGRKEIITSKDFKGGKVTAVFGGCEINLLQADSPDTEIVLDIRATFGGCEIIVPSHWDVRNEIEPVFGSVEDQRTIRTQETNEGRKTLILQGSCIFGGIEIKSF